MSLVYVCIAKQSGRLLAIFPTQEMAKNSWRITYSSIPEIEVNFKVSLINDSRVEVHAGGQFVGEIQSYEMLQSPDHL